jgi:hypothetical protein
VRDAVRAIDRLGHETLARLAEFERRRAAEKEARRGRR